MNVGDMINTLSAEKRTVVQNAFRAALCEGIDTAVAITGAVGGFNSNPDLRLEWPSDVATVAARMRSIGLGNVIDDFVVAINAAAEGMCRVAGPTLKKAVDGIPSNHRVGEVILSRDPTACTAYYNECCYNDLARALLPLMRETMEAGATKCWDDLFKAYNRIPHVSKVYVDIHMYCVKKALDGLLLHVGRKEADIRVHPLVSAKSSIVKEVFSLDFWRL